MNYLQKISLFMLFAVLTFFSALLLTYIFLDIATLYNLTFITNLTFTQLVGTLFIISIMKTKLDNKIEKFDEWIKTAFNQLSTAVIFILISWGYAYIVNYIITF